MEVQTYPKQTKNKVFLHAPYDMYSEYQPIFGYFIDDDPASDTFGQVLFGQIGEKNLQAEVDSYKDDTDMTIIKQQLLNCASADDWTALYVEDEEDEESAGLEVKNSTDTPIYSDEDTSKSGTIDNENKDEA